MALDFPSGVDNGYEWTDPSNGVTYVYDAVKNSWTAAGGPGSGGGLGPDDIAAGGGLEINVDGKLQVKVNEDGGITNTVDGISVKANEAGGITTTTDGVTVKTYETYGIEIDSTEGVRQGDTWTSIPDLPSS